MDRRLFAKTALAAVAGVTAGGVSKIEAAPRKNAKEKPDSQVMASNEAEEQIKVIQSRRYYKHQGKQIQGKCASLLFFADVHLVPRHLKKIATFYRKHKKYIDDSIHLGDSVGNFFEGNFSEFWDIFPESLNVIGNHDCDLDAKTPRRTQMPNIDKFKNYFQPYVKGWKVVQPADAEEKGKCYWYKDYQNFLRVIGIDCMDLNNNAQYEWFTKALAEAKEKNLMIIITTHVSPLCGEALPCNFTSLDYEATSGGMPFKRYVEAIDAFISDGGTFVSWICGHDHSDKIAYAKFSKNKQLVIILECATDFSWWTDGVHIPNTATETCWEIISVETKTNVLKIARFGNNYDHYLRHKGSLCYDFKNHKLISQY